MNKRKPLEQIAKLLPDGLTESMINSIAELIHEKIEEEVKLQKDALTIKVKAFIRSKVDALKEQAIKELELENDTYRDAQLFNSMKAIFATELTSDDEANAVNLMAAEQNLTENKLEILAGELNTVLEENKKLKSNLKVLSDKNTALESTLEKQKKLVNESKAATSMRLSETAVVVSTENFQRQGKGKTIERKVAPAQDRDGGNQFLTEESLHLMGLKRKG